MSRIILRRTLSVATLSAALSPVAVFAQPAIINGGGATAPQADYAGPNNPTTGAPQSELSLFNSSQTKVQFGTYWGSGSGAGQQAFIQDDLTCDINKVTGANGGKCSNTPGGANTVWYGASDGPLSASQYSSWTTSSFGQSAAGNLIQLPMLGTGPAIIVNDSNITANGELQLSSNDLCGIFSGKITDFSQITDSKTKPAAGIFQLVYRLDSSGTTTLLTNHLASGICTSANTNPGVTFTATSTFASLFPSGINTVIPNAVGETGSAGVANYLALGGTGGTPIPLGIGYDAPDWTSLTPKSPQVLSNGQPSPLLAAALFNGKTAYTPITSSIVIALTHVTAGTNLTPPSTPAEGADPLLWVPVIQTSSSGYPMVGYGSWDLAQCDANKTIGTEIEAFLKLHYTNSSYLSINANDGEVPLKSTNATKFLTTIEAHILKNGSPTWNTDIDNKTACTGLPGR